MSCDLFKDILPSIMVNNTKVEFENKEYIPYVVNKALSFHIDCVLQVNQMNIVPSTDKKMQYDYLCGTIRKYRRPFQKWQKRETLDALETIKEYYNYSNERAKEVMHLFSDVQITELRNRLEKGGIQKKTK